MKKNLETEATRQRILEKFREQHKDYLSSKSSNTALKPEYNNHSCNINNVLGDEQSTLTGKNSVENPDQ